VALPSVRFGAVGLGLRVNFKYIKKNLPVYITVQGRPSHTSKTAEVILLERRMIELTTNWLPLQTINVYRLYKTSVYIIHLLTATFKDMHIENSKNYER